MTIKVPTQEVELERLKRLQSANVIRSKRARLKEHIAEGRIPLSEVLLADKCHLRTMKLCDLLLAVPRLGPAKVNAALNRNRIGPSVTLENFSHQRRLALLEWLRANHRSVRV